MMKKELTQEILHKLVLYHPTTGFLQKQMVDICNMT
jgi:hypothetical protein